MTNPDHAGLAKGIEALAPIADLFADQGLTRTDIWALSALAATEVALPESMTDITLDLHWIGRRTCESFGDCGNDSRDVPTICAEMFGPHRQMCHGGAGTMHRENSGQSGRWDLSSTSLDAGKFYKLNFMTAKCMFSVTDFLAGYWIELLGQPPNYAIQEIDNSDLPGIPNRRQWLGIINGDSSVVMLNTDIALVRNIPDIEDGINCSFQTCSTDTPFA
jgi:hypothetical protein